MELSWPKVVLPSLSPSSSLSSNICPTNPSEKFCVKVPGDIALFRCGGDSTSFSSPKSSSNGGASAST
jgi:hypothetical protein